ncbi:hypothetical protein ACSQ67_017446 [Phaseolus vulgaris]
MIRLLSGNKLTGDLPEELGHLPVLDRIQIDENNITGSIPLSFANLNSTKHFHMNNNSLSGQIPAQLSKLGSLIHLLLDNNNLTGNLPSELSETPKLMILQLDNNNFDGNSIPESYANMSKLLKLSLRNCNLKGPIPDFSRIPHLTYLDLSFNQLNESIPTNKLYDNMTTIDLSNNKLNGTIPTYFSGLPRLQKLSVANNSISGTVPSTIWQNRTLNATEELILYMQHNQLTSISGSTNLPPNVTLLLEGNPVCSNNNSLVQFCGRESDNDKDGGSTVVCPSFSDFRAYVKEFENFLTDGLSVHTNQLFIERFTWEEGRLRMNLKLFPEYVDNTSSREFSRSEVIRIRDMFREWDIHDSDFFGPYELLDFILLDLYNEAITPSSSSGISKGALAGIILGAIACAVTLSAIVSILILRIRLRDYRALSKRRNASRISLKVEGVRSFDYKEMALATNNFSESAQIGEGGYGKVYKGRLSDGTVVAIKRAQEGSLQGEREFLTEIELLSRLHHRNLVSLIGYCDEEGEQGYLDPEYFLTRNLTDKSDVYSLGVVFLELLTGRPPIFHGENIIRQVNMAYQSGGISLVVDKRIESYPFEYAVRFLTLALKCCKDLPDERPKMAEVARELEYICSMLLEPDSKEVEYVTSDSSSTIFSSQPSSSTIKTSFISGDVSGSDLVSGSVPTIKPR